MRCELRDAQGHVVAEGVGARSLSQDYGDINKSLKMVEKIGAYRRHIASGWIVGSVYAGCCH